MQWGNNIIILSWEDREFVRGKTRGFREHYHCATLFIYHLQLSISLVILHLPCFYFICITLLTLTFFPLVSSFFLSLSFSISFPTCQKMAEQLYNPPRFPPVTVLTNHGKDLQRRRKPNKHKEKTLGIYHFLFFVLPQERKSPFTPVEDQKCTIICIVSIKMQMLLIT